MKDRQPRVKRKPEEPSTSVSVSPAKILKTQLIEAKQTLVKCKKKVKVLQQSKRRLKKKVENLEHILNSLKEKLNFSEEDCSLLTSLSKNAECLVKKAVDKSANPNLKRVPYMTIGLSHLLSLYTFYHQKHTYMYGKRLTLLCPIQKHWGGGIKVLTPIQDFQRRYFEL